MRASREAYMATTDVERSERTFVDAEGVTIHYYSWSSPEPKGILQIVHGKPSRRPSLQLAFLCTPTTTAGTVAPELSSMQAI
jgi:hypothetical protein